MNNKNFEDISKIISARIIKKAPAYQWQDLALEIIKELNIPNFKKSSVFKLCKEKDRQFIINCLNDTKELCKTGEKWKYFFKVANSKNEKTITTPGS